LETLKFIYGDLSTARLKSLKTACKKEVHLYFTSYVNVKEFSKYKDFWPKSRLSRSIKKLLLSKDAYSKKYGLFVV